MTSKPVISVEHLTKQYDLGVIGTGTISRDLNRWWARVRKQPDPYTRIGQQDAFARIGESILALDDVSFTVQQGEALGIIGRNGAGKSTLLKILSRVTAPTSGVVKVKGRIGSLLEVGTGFHPELTGRENVYLNGAILGMRKEEVTKKFDEIVDFSGVEKFIDTPVKRYSSGMYVRLAFAVAAHLDPEILIVDEVLAVGDAEFQKKCLGKMGDVAGEGRTVLFVSHNMVAIRSICKNGILLRNGSIFGTGEINKVVNDYLSTDRIEVLEQKWNSIETAPGNDIVRVKEIQLSPFNCENNIHLTVNSSFELNFTLWIFSPASLNISLHVKSLGGEIIFAAPSPSVDCEPGVVTFTCKVPGNFMNDGIYSVNLMIVKDSKSLFTLNDAIVFEVQDIERQGYWLGKWPGSVRPKFDWEYNISHLSDFS